MKASRRARRFGGTAAARSIIILVIVMVALVFFAPGALAQSPIVVVGSTNVAASANLPVTGENTDTLAVIGAAILLLGGLIVLAARRVPDSATARDRREPSPDEPRRGLRALGDKVVALVGLVILKLFGRR